MDWAGSQASEILQVSLGRITLVYGEFVSRVSHVLLNHYPVPGNLGNYGGSGNG